MFPAKNGLTLDGIKVSDEALNELLRVNPEEWEAEMEDSKQFLSKFGKRLPRQISEEHDKLARRIPARGNGVKKVGVSFSARGAARWRADGGMSSVSKAAGPRSK